MSFRADFKTLVTAKYGNFLVSKVLKYGKKEHREEIIRSFAGNVVKLMKNPISAPIVDTAYTEYASAKAKCQMLQEFCAPDFKMYKDTSALNLDEFFQTRPERLPEILKNLKHDVLKILAK